MYSQNDQEMGEYQTNYVKVKKNRRMVMDMKEIEIEIMFAELELQKKLRIIAEKKKQIKELEKSVKQDKKWIRFWTEILRIINGE